MADSAEEAAELRRVNEVLMEKSRALRAQVMSHAAVVEDLRLTSSERDTLQVKLEGLTKHLVEQRAAAQSQAAIDAAKLREERAEAATLRQEVAERDRAAAAAEGEAADARRAAGPREARLTAVEAALRSKDSESQALRVVFRAKENEAVALESKLAAQSGRLVELEAAVKAAAGSEAAGRVRELEASRRLESQKMQLAGWEESCRSQVAAAVSNALAAVSAQLSEGQGREVAARAAEQRALEALHTVEDQQQAEAQQTERLAQQLEDYSARLAGATGECASLQRDLAASEAAAADGRARRERAEAALARSHDQLAAVNRQLSDREAVCSSLAAEVAAAKRSATAAETALQLAHSAAAVMRQQLATSSAAMQPLQLVEGQLMALQRQHAEAVAKCQRLTEAVEAADRDTTVLKFDLAAAQSQVAALTSKAEGQASELRQSRQQLAGSRQQLDAATARAATFQQQVASLEAASRRLQTAAGVAEESAAEAGRQLADQCLALHERENEVALRRALVVAAEEQSQYVTMTTDVIASLSATTKQLEGDISASRAALDAAQAQLAATAALQHHTAAEAAATEQRLMATQDELRQQRAATAFRDNFAAELADLLGDTRGALAEARLSVRHLHQQALTARGGGSGSVRGSGVGGERSGRDAELNNLQGLQKCRTTRGSQTSFLDMWARSNGPWGHSQLRQEMFDNLSGEASDAHTPYPAEESIGAPSSITTTLRHTLPAHAVARLVSEVYSAKAAADAAAAEAGRPPVAMRRFVRSFVERRHGTGTEAAAALMLDLVTGVAAHAVDVPAVAAFGLVAGILREHAPPPNSRHDAEEVNNDNCGGTEGDGTDGVGDGAWERSGFHNGDGTAFGNTGEDLAGQVALDECSEVPAGGDSLDVRSSAASLSVNPGIAVPAGLTAAEAAVAAESVALPGARSLLELDALFWHQQELHQQAGNAHLHAASMKLLCSQQAATAFTRLPYDPSRLLLPRSPLHKQTAVSAVDQCPPLLAVRNWGAAVHPCAAGVLSELLAIPGLEAALSVLQDTTFLRQLHVQECGLQVTERQAPRLHTLFAAACEAVGFQSARDAQTCRMGDTGDRGDSRDDGAPAWGPRLYVLSSPETAVYCVRIPVAEVTPPGHQRPQSHQPQQTSALRVGASSPGEPTLATGATTEDEYSSELRSTVLTSAAVNGATGVQLDRSRWRGVLPRGGKPGPSLPSASTSGINKSEAMVVAVVVTGAAVDLLRPPELRAAFVAALSLAVLPPPGAAQHPWTTRQAPSVMAGAQSGFHGQREHGTAILLGADDRNSSVPSEHDLPAGWQQYQDSSGGVDVPSFLAATAAADAHSLAVYREGAMPPGDTAVAATVWRNLCTAIGCTGLAPATAAAALTAAGVPRPQQLLAALQRAGRHLSLCTDRVALAATGDVALVVETLLKLTCGASSLDGQLSADVLLEEARSLEGHAARRRGNAMRTDGGRAVCGSLALLRSRELLRVSKIRTI